MTPPVTATVWAQDALADAEGAIRPGGTALTDRAVSLAALPAGALVVDVGAGGGATVAHLTAAGVRCVGLEPDAGLASRAAHRCVGAVVVRASAQALPFATGSVDLVLAECVLSVLDRPEQALAEAARVLRPHGVLVLSDLYARETEAEEVLDRLPAGSCLRGARPMREVLALVRDAGLRPGVWEDHSDALRRMAVRLVWSGVGTDRLWCNGTSTDPHTPGVAVRAAVDAAVRAAVRAARPGYYLLLAHAPGG